MLKKYTNYTAAIRVLIPWPRPAGGNIAGLLASLPTPLYKIKKRPRMILLVSCESLTYCKSNAIASQYPGNLLTMTSEVTPLRY